VSLRVLALALALGCQGTSSDPPAQASAAAPAPVPPGTRIEARRNGVLEATVITGNPCHATVGAIDASVAGPPLLADIGGVRWTGETSANGTTLRKGLEPAARIFDSGDSTTIFDPAGVPLLRVVQQGDSATQRNAARQTTRFLGVKGGAIIISAPSGDSSVTGTADLLLAAVLTAPEISPEVRALAACHRLLPEKN
jgi:hypothetical protein